MFPGILQQYLTFRENDNVLYLLTSDKDIDANQFRHKNCRCYGSTSSQTLQIKS